MPEPKILYRCDCGHEGTYWFRRNGKIACFQCDSPLEWSRTTTAAPFEPVVFFEDAAGNKRFPAAPDAPVPAGFERRELRTIHEVRNFERAVNQEERAEWDEYRNAEDRAFGEQRQARHAELRAAMQHMSPYGRDFAQVAMEQTNRKGRGSYEAGFRLEVFSENAGNREAYRDERTGWRSRRA